MAFAAAGVPDAAEMARRGAKTRREKNTLVRRICDGVRDARNLPASTRDVDVLRLVAELIEDGAADAA